MDYDPEEYVAGVERFPHEMENLRTRLLNQGFSDLNISYEQLKRGYNDDWVEWNLILQKGEMDEADVKRLITQHLQEVLPTWSQKSCAVAVNGNRVVAQIVLFQPRSL